MTRFFAAILCLSLCLFVVSITAPIVLGGDAVAVVNGDTNGDGDRDISDATYYLRWLFRGGPEPIAIICPEDQAARVSELESQLATAQEALGMANAELDIANTDNSMKAEEIVALQEQLAAANASLAECEAEPEPEPEPEPGPEPEPEPGV